MEGQKRAAIILPAGVLALVIAVIPAAATRAIGAGSPDLPPLSPEVSNYLQLRDEYTARLRGIEPGLFANPLWRTRAVQARERQEKQLEQQAAPNAPQPAWSEIGPDTITNGQALDGSHTAVSGRVTAIAVDPTNSSKVYLGTAQGGVWRSLDGGSTWTALFDSAQSLSIGALAVAPSNPSTVYVGTGEPNNSADTFFGVGVYRIDNADTSAALVGPINPLMTFTCNPSVCTGSFSTHAFTGRGISQILVSPSDAATIFVSTATGVSGLGANALSNTIPPLGLRGVYRSTNVTAAAASVTFTKLAVTTDNSFDSPGTGNTSISDMAFVNGNPNTLVVAASGSMTGGGVWRSTNALSVPPTFTNTLFPGFNGLWHRFAVTGNTVLVTSNESVTGGAGRLRESTDGGATWGSPLPAADGFCGGQCSYDNPVGVDPRTSGAIYLGGSAGTSQPGSSGLKVSNTNGTTFAVDQTGLHADFHSIIVDSLTNPSTVWVGNDGGVWKRAANASVGTAWTNLNNSLGTLQFQSVAVGKSDAFLAIGGTQDNGTEIQQTSLGNWSGADFGDGGFALIDQSTTSTTNVTMYHTYFNLTNALIGFARTNMTGCVGWTGSSSVWVFRGAGGGSDATPGCDGTAKAATNGINIGNAVEFYAPMALGPGTPNTLYFGTDRLYRSTDKGDTMSVVSQAPIFSGSPITTIGISPTNDNVRIVGLQNGQVWATTTGSSTLTNVTSGSFPANPTGSTTNKWVGRAVVDPNNSNTAYVTFSFYAPAGQGVWKTTNLSAATPTWTAAANGIPSVPVDAFVVDPNDSTHLFAGTDVGVYASTDGGATWAPFGTGLPAVAVFDMAIVRPGTSSEALRIATHGRSMWQVSLSTAPHVVADFDGDGKSDVSVFRPSEGRWYIHRSSDSGLTLTDFGVSTDVPVPADYDGDGKADIAVFRPSEGRWYIKRSSDNALVLVDFGTSTDVPVPADYDGDGKADVAVFRPSEGRWYIRRSSDNGLTLTDFGLSSDVQVPADYDGDGKADIAVYRRSEGRWYVKRSSDNTLVLSDFGASNDVPLPSDYDGDGKADVAVFRPSEGRWYVRRSSDSGLTLTDWGTSSDRTEPGDYEGDGKTDVSVFRPSEGRWYVRRSSDSGLVLSDFGLSSDVELPLPYAIRKVFFP